MICHILQQVPCHIHGAHHYSSDHPCPNAETTWEGSQGKGQAGSFPKVMLQVNSPLDSHPLVPLSICILTLTHCNGRLGEGGKTNATCAQTVQKMKEGFWPALSAFCWRWEGGCKGMHLSLGERVGGFVASREANLL